MQADTDSGEDLLKRSLFDHRCGQTLVLLAQESGDAVFETRFFVFRFGFCRTLAFGFRCAVRLIGRPQTAVIAVAGLRIQGCEHVAGRTDVVAGVEVAENRVVFRAFETAGIRRCDRATESLVERIDGFGLKFF